MTRCGCRSRRPRAYLRDAARKGSGFHRTQAEPPSFPACRRLGLVPPEAPDADDPQADQSPAAEAPELAAAYLALQATIEGIRGRMLDEPDRMADQVRARAVLERFGGAGRVGRNDPCPCGSGKKFKRCCMRLIEDARWTLGATA